LCGEFHLEEGCERVRHILVDGMKLQVMGVNFEYFNYARIVDYFAFFCDFCFFLLEIFGIGEGKYLFYDDFGSGDGCFAEGIVIIEQRDYHALFLYFYCKIYYSPFG
jgi:hypothetical protein